MFDRRSADVSATAAPSTHDARSAVALRWSAVSLVVTVWTSALLFGVYILAYYAGALGVGALDEWNEVLPRLYEPSTPAATAGIGLHFAAGGILLVLGSIQLIEAIRIRRPAVHRWIGRVYASAAVAAGVGGLTFIVAKGTVGGVVMDVGFGLYGALMILAAIQTVRHARAGRLVAHRAWALRLYALAIGSWLYRMDYGFWFLLADGAGHAKDFHGPFDFVMAFFFYAPNLLVVEAWLRGRRSAAPAAARFAAAGVLAGAAAFLLVGTYYFTRYLWGPAILHRIAG